MHATVKHNVLAADRNENATTTDILASSKGDNLNGHCPWFFASDRVGAWAVEKKALDPRKNAVKQMNWE